MSKALGKQIAIDFTQNLLGDVSGNQAAFTVSGQEYKYVPGGPLVNKTYAVESVSRKADTLDTIVLTLGNLTRFNNVAGDLTVAYDASKGNLAGAGGAVSSFSSVFTPDELLMKPNQNDIEHISIFPDVLVDLIKIDYLRRYNQENISVGVSYSINLVYVSVEDPT